MKKTLIGFIIMVVAMFMALSGAVNAATKMTVEGAKNVEVGDEITLTVKFPEAFGYQFTVNFDDTKLEYLGTLEAVKNGSFTVAFQSTGDERFTSYDLKFKALEKGDVNITISDLEFVSEDVELIDVEAPDPITFSITEPVTDPEPTPDPDGNTTGNENNTTGDNTTGDENNIGNNNTTTDDENGNVAGNTDNGNTNKEDDGDKTITSLKDAKTGFDIMYVAYLLMAIVVAAVIVKVSKRK